jgi:hypothetical protein
MMWSAPRSRSTAFERMMIERGDHHVVHEPFSHVVDFGACDVGSDTPSDQLSVMEALLTLGSRGPVFVKDTTDFRYVDLLADKAFLRQCTHAFLIREPAAAIASHARLVSSPNRDEVGFAWLHEIHARVVEVTGEQPVVLSSDDLVRDPTGAVRAYCEAVGLPYMPSAMTWEPRMLPIWARSQRWHTAAARSTGFQGSPDGDLAVAAVVGNPTLEPLYRYHQPYYEKLHAHRLRW